MKKLNVLGHKCLFVSSLMLLLLLNACSPNASQRAPLVGISFETLQTEYWVESYEVIKAELERRGFRTMTAVADGDEKRQFDQVNSFLVRNVDALVIVPKNKQSIIPAIRAANASNTPVVIYNRPIGSSDVLATVIQADNYTIAKKAVDFMVETARKTGGTYKAAILIGDLADTNAVSRREGFEDAIRGHEDWIEVVARIPTEWNQEKARTGISNALQSNPDINFIFTSSDFMLPSIVSALKSMEKWKPRGEIGHVILGGFDGDATAYGLLLEGYLDVTGVQDLYYQAEMTVDSIQKALAGEHAPEQLLDLGFVIHQDNLREMEGRMWGAQVYKRQNP